MPTASATATGESPPTVNLVVLRGVASAPPELRTLTSGRRIATLSVRVHALDPGATSVPVAVREPPGWLEDLDEGAPIVVVGGRSAAASSRRRPARPAHGSRWRREPSAVAPTVGASTRPGAEPRRSSTDCPERSRRRIQETRGSGPRLDSRARAWVVTSPARRTTESRPEARARTAETTHLKPESLEDVVIRFAGDSGDGMQLTGDRFTDVSAVFGNDLATLPNFPAEIRAPAGTIAGVSSFQVHISDHEILTPGDAPGVLVAMNPAALKANITDSCRAARSS